MGKVDDMRAMREARFAERQQTQTSIDRAARVARTPTKVSKVVEVKLPDPKSLCGHTSISGKKCSREKDHSEKNHRYPK